MGNFLVCLNSASNFAIYCVIGERPQILVGQLVGGIIGSQLMWPIIAN